MVEETRDVHVEDGENSFKMLIGFNFKQLKRNLEARTGLSKA
jgi:hypothetical protein